MTAETSNARGEAEYEYEVWQGDALQAGGSTTDYASAQSEAGHYAMMYAPDGPVEVRIYEKRLLAAAPPPADAQQQGQAVVWVSTADIAPFVGAPQMAEFWGTVTLASGPGDGRTVPLYLTAAQQQGDKEVNMDVTVRDGAWVGTYAEWRRRNRVAPPSAPVGVERKYPDDGNGDDDAYNRGWNDCLDAIAQQPAAGAAMEFDGTDREVLREFIRICREHKPVGPWPGERVCKAIERAMDNENPFRFIAEADMAPERAPSMKDADRMLSGPRRAAGHLDRKRFERAPCYLCGYNGEGYYQPDKHPCAARYHAQQPAADPRSTHRVWRGDDWQPCYCEATDDHRIGSEQPAAVDGAVLP